MFLGNRTSRTVTLGYATIFLRVGRRSGPDQPVLESLETTNLFAETVLAVPAALCPVKAAGVAIGTTRATRQHASRGCGKVPLDFVAKRWGHQRCKAQKARVDALERALVIVALVGWLACGLVHDEGTSVEKDFAAVPEMLSAIEPHLFTCVVVHDSGA